MLPTACLTALLAALAAGGALPMHRSMPLATSTVGAVPGPGGRDHARVTPVRRPGPARRAPVMGWNTWCTTVECGVDWCNSKEVRDACTCASTYYVAAIAIIRTHFACYGVALS